MGSMMKYALPAVGVALPFMFPAAAGAAAAGAAGAGAAAGGAGLAGTGLAGGAAIPLSGVGPGGIGMASFGGGPIIGGAPFLPNSSGGLFTSMGVGPNTVMPHAGFSPGVFPTSPGEAFGAPYGPSGHGATIFNTNLAQPASPWSRFKDALGKVDWSKHGDAFSGGANQEQDQMQSLPPPLMGPPIMGGNLEHGGTSFSQTMAPAITPELDPSVLPPVDPWGIPDVMTAVPDDRYMGQGTALYPPKRIEPRIPMDLSGFGGY